MDKLSQLLMDYVLGEGACAAGIATVETLADGPPSADLNYVLPGAKSALVFAVPLEVSHIEPFLAKRDRLAHERDNLRTNALASGLALHVAKYLEQTKGLASVPVAANEIYRPDVPGGPLAMLPDIALRYLAVRSGVGHLGLSGNIITASHGAAVILGAMVTTAELTPTAPLPPEESYCDGCRLCIASCASALMDPEEKTEVTLGGITFAYARRRSYLRCEFVCGGFTGLHPSGKWSTWSPGRFSIPENDADFLPLIIRGVKANGLWPKMAGGHYHVLMREKLYLTCGHCQLVCNPDKEIRKRRYEMLTSCGVCVQHPDGSLEFMSPVAAKNHLAGLSPAWKEMYGET